MDLGERGGEGEGLGGEERGDITYEKRMKKTGICVCLRLSFKKKGSIW